MVTLNKLEKKYNELEVKKFCSLIKCVINRSIIEINV